MEFLPYTIHHLQITEAAGLAAPAAPAYVVLWWRKLPLGHVWIDSGEALPQHTFCENIIAGASASLHYYLAGEDIWKRAFRRGDAVPLAQLLQASSSLQTFLKPHAAGAISVVVCTRNRTQALGQCIRALLQSSDKNFELVIVDNAPDNDATELFVKQFGGVRYVREPRKGLDIARNTGAQAASHEIVAYTDDDVTPDAHWIENVKAAFANENTACVTGLVVPVELETEWQVYFERQWGFNKGYVPLVFDAAYFEKHKSTGVPVWDIGAGANMAFRKSLFLKAGYFDERLDVGAAGCSGDSEMWYRALAEGFECRYFPQLFVYHQHRSTRADLYKQIFYYMRGQVASLLVQYERYGHRGNLHRLYTDLPKWYKHRLKQKLRGSKDAGAATLFTEIRGCISGWRFYRKHRGARR